MKHFNYGAQLTEKHKLLNPNHYFIRLYKTQILLRMITSTKTSKAHFHGTDASPLDNSATILVAQTTTEAIAMQIQTRMILNNSKYLNCLICPLPENFIIH